jgi:hypothetical protein
MDTKASVASQNSAQNVVPEYPYQPASISGSSVGSVPLKTASDVKLTLKIKK